MQSKEKIKLNNIKERLIFLAPTVQGGRESESNIKDFEMQGMLGQGGCGTVYKAKHIESGDFFALKQILKSTLVQNDMIPQMKTEIKIMYELYHPNIVKLYNHFEEDDSIYLIMELAEGGQLYQKLKQKVRFDERTCQKIISQMVLALEHCHTRNPPIIHRDIKPENVLIDQDGNIKLADFGWSQVFSAGNRRKTYCGTLDYFAPEMITLTGHDTTLDIWCLGVLTYELISGKSPFAPPENILDSVQRENITTNNILNAKITWPKDFPPLVKDFCSKLLKKLPRQRLSIEEIKLHPWLSQTFLNIQNEKPNKGLQQNGHQNNLVQTSGGSFRPSTMPKNGFTTQEIESLSSERKLLKPLKQSVTKEEFDIVMKGLNQSLANERPSERMSTTSHKEDLDLRLKEANLEQNELQLKLKLKDKEIIQVKESLEQLKKDLKGISATSLESNEINKLEEDKKRLKEDIEDTWSVVEDKETELIKVKSELKKEAELKQQAARYKEERSELQKTVQELQNELFMALTDIQQLKEERREQQHEQDSIIKGAEKENPSLYQAHSKHLLEKILSVAKNCFRELQPTETSIQVSELEHELRQLQIQNSRLRSEYQDKIVQGCGQIQRDNDDKINIYVRDSKRERNELKQKYLDKIHQLENELQDLAVINEEKSEYDNIISGLQGEVNSQQEQIQTLETSNKNYETIFYGQKAEIEKYTWMLMDKKYKLENIERKSLMPENSGK